MATYRLDGFKFNRENIRGIDSDCLKGINGYLSSRETAINTIATNTFICSGGPFHGQPIELEDQGEYYKGNWQELPKTAPITVGAWSGRYQVVKGENGGFAAVWCEGCNAPGIVSKDTAFYSNVPAGAKLAKTSELGRGFVRLGEFLASMAELQDGEFANFKIGRTAFKVANTPERIEQLRARVIKAKKWFSDKHLSEPREVSDVESAAALDVAVTVATAQAMADAMAPEAINACEATTAPAHAMACHGADSGAAAGHVSGSGDAGFVRISGGFSADSAPEPMGISGTRGNTGTHGNIGAVAEPVGISDDAKRIASRKARQKKRESIELAR